MSPRIKISNRPVFQLLRWHHEDLSRSSGFGFARRLRLRGQANVRPQAPRGMIEPSTQSGQFQLQRAQRCVLVRGRCKLNTNRQPSLKQTTQQKECEFLPKIWHYLYGLMGRCAEPGWISTRYTWFGRSNPSQSPPLPSRPTADNGTPRHLTPATDLPGRLAPRAILRGPC